MQIRHTKRDLQENGYIAPVYSRCSQTLRLEQRRVASLRYSPHKNDSASLIYEACYNLPIGVRKILKGDACAGRGGHIFWWDLLGTDH